MAALTPAIGMFECNDTVSAAEETDESVSVTTRNRKPLAPSMFSLLPLGSIKPRGWLKDQLTIQANGLSGHLDETWADVGPDSGWLGGKGEAWERGPYFLDGLVPLAWLLDDERLKAKAKRFVDWTLDHQLPNGNFGPANGSAAASSADVSAGAEGAALLSLVDGEGDWWPNIIMLKALVQYQEASGDPRVIPFMDKYFRYQLAALPKHPLSNVARVRWQDELLTVIWLYNRTGSLYLLDLARLLHEQGYDWIAQYQDFQYTDRITAEFLKAVKSVPEYKDLGDATHGVNNAQAIKTGPVWSLVSASDADRSAVTEMMSDLDYYHGLPNGMFSCDELFAGRSPSQGSELCAVVEYMFSLEQSLAITGDVSLGDRLEKLAFNSLPGALSDDMWSHQYNQQPNQVECSLHQKPWATDGPESNLFGLEPNFACCTANFSQGWPKFNASLFMLSGDQNSADHDGLVAAAYAPCELRTIIRGTAVHVVEETEYPFRETVLLTLNPASPLRFPLQLRIPSWAAGATLAVNGKREPAPRAGAFALVDREWHAGDRVEVTLPMTPRITHGYHDSVTVERGPLVFSYGIGEDWVKLRDRGLTADWQIFPTNQWNFALEADAVSNPKAIEVVEGKMSSVPFTRRGTPIQLRIKARRVNDWRAEDGSANPVPKSPVSTNEAEETITLIPYAAAKLRITAFPHAAT